MKRSPSILGGLGRGLSGLTKLVKNTTKTVFPSKVDMKEVRRAFDVYRGASQARNTIALNPKENIEFNKLVAEYEAQKKFSSPNWQVVSQNQRRANSVVGPSNRRNRNGNRGPPPAAGPANSNSGSPKLTPTVIKRLTRDQKDEIIQLAINMQNLDEALMASDKTVFDIASEIANIIHERKQRQQNKGPPAAGPANSNKKLNSELRQLVRVVRHQMRFKQLSQQTNRIRAGNKQLGKRTIPQILLGKKFTSKEMNDALEYANEMINMGIKTNIKATDHITSKYKDRTLEFKNLILHHFKRINKIYIKK